VRDITAITVHHTADGGQRSFAASQNIRRVEAMRRYHVDELGWIDIAYHRLIDVNGEVHVGRALALHPDSRTEGVDFTGHVFVAVIGNFEEEQPTGPMLASLRRVTAELCHDFQLSALDVRPHCAYVDTLCPGKHILAATQ
jgi:hypothetical protein